MSSTRLPSRDALHTRLSRFVPAFTLALTADEVPASVEIPDEWRQQLGAGASGRPAVPREWDEFREVLPTVWQYFEEALLGTAVLLRPGERPALLYVHTYDGGARPSFYVGGPPVREAELPPRIAAIWSKLPAKLRRFYTTLHDGWTELASDAGGPARVEKLAFLSDDEWDLDARAVAALPFRMEDVLLVLSNAAGDYLGLDTSVRSWDGSSQAVLFFHDEPTAPEVGQDFWTLLDTWFGIFAERADRVR